MGRCQHARAGMRLPEAQGGSRGSPAREGRAQENLALSTRGREGTCQLTGAQCTAGYPTFPSFSRRALWVPGNGALPHSPPQSWAAPRKSLVSAGGLRPLWGPGAGRPGDSYSTGRLGARGAWPRPRRRLGGAGLPAPSPDTPTQCLGRAGRNRQRRAGARTVRREDRACVHTAGCLRWAARAEQTPRRRAEPLSPPQGSCQSQSA